MTNEQIQSILDEAINLWLKYWNDRIQKLTLQKEWWTYFVSVYMYWQKVMTVTIEHILYNPDSNFFEVMFPWEQQTNDEDEATVMWYLECRKYEIYKLQSLLSKDPIQYVWDNSPLLAKFRE